MIKGFTYEQITDLNIAEAVDEWYNTRDNTPENKVKREKLIYKYGHISKWDTSRVTSMYKLFWCKRDFNDDISEWNVSNVLWMEYMFSFVNNVNQPIHKWNFNRGEHTENMFWNSGRVVYLDDINKKINESRNKSYKRLRYVTPV